MVKKTKKSRKKINKNKFFIWVLFIITLILIILSIYIPRYIYLDIKTIKAKIIVSDFVGIDIGNETLSFGAVQPGGTSTRTLIIDNNHDTDVIFEVIPKQGMEKFISRKSYLIKEGDKAEISVSAYVVPGTSFGTYEGEVKFVIRRKLF